MSPKETTGIRLDSWKAIAEYLNRNVRTVIRWEQTRGLPVRRLPGEARGAIYAFKAEIDQWLESQKQSAASEAVIALPVGPPSLWSHLVQRWVRWTLVIIALAICATIGLRAWKYAHKTQPSEVAFTSDSIEVSDDHGKRLWDYRFPDPLTKTGIIGGIDPLTGERETGEIANRAWIVDLNGNGEQNVLIKVRFRGKTSLHNDERVVLSCFDAAGHLIWSYEPTGVLKFGGRTFGPPWNIWNVLISDEPGPKHIWVNVINYTWGKSFIARLDAKGNATVQFVHSGEIDVLERLHSPTGPRLWIGGFNDEYDTASLAILGDTQYAVSPQTNGTRFACLGCGSGDPLEYFVFPRYDMSRAIHNPNNKVFGVNAQGTEIEVHQAEISRQDQVIYDFSNSDTPSPVRVGYASSFWPNHLDLEKQGKLDHALSKCPDRLHPPSVRVFRSGQWSEVQLSNVSLP